MALGTALQSQPVGARDAATAQALWSFVMDRLRGYCLGREATVEQFEATLAMGVSDLADFDRRLQALRAFAGTPAAVSLSAAAKRARNLLQQAQEGQAPFPFAFDRFEAAEQALYEALSQVQNVVEPLAAEGQYVRALETLARLKQPVDDFFASVMVMADDPVQRANRIALLSRLDRLCGSVVDLSCLPG
jgi:Glycyl-tRNA synthetase, beta subunit